MKIIKIKTDDIIEIRLTKKAMENFQNVRNCSIDTFIASNILNKTPIKAGNDPGHYIGPLWAVYYLFAEGLYHALGQNIFEMDEIRIIISND